MVCSAFLKSLDDCAKISHSLSFIYSTVSEQQSAERVPATVDSAVSRHKPARPQGASALAGDAEDRHTGRPSLHPVDASRREKNHRRADWGGATDVSSQWKTVCTSKVYLKSNSCVLTSEI